MFYYLYYFSRVPFAREDLQLKPSQELSAVSVLICAHNELSNLQRFLPRLYSQQYPQFEILVVNDRSDDGTKEWLAQQSYKQQQLKVVDIHSKPKGVNGKKYGITQGIKTAQYEIILLTDADCYPVNNLWIQQMAKDFIDGTEIILGFSQYEKTNHLLNSFIRFETLYTGLQYISMALAGKPYMGVGRNLAYKRSFFLERKGFEKHLHITGGDDDLFVNHNANAQNSKVAIGSNSLIKSIPKSNYSDFFKQKKRHLSVGKYYKLNDKINLGLLSLSHIFFWVTFVILVGFGKELLVIGFVLLFKAFLLYLVFIPSSIKLGDKIDGWNLLILDFLYPIYLIIIGFPALTAKSIKWS